MTIIRKTFFNIINTHLFFSVDLLDPAVLPRKIIMDEEKRLFF